MSTGKRLKMQRIKAGMTQGQLADAIGVSRQTISAYEGDVRNLTMGAAVDLARVLKCSIGDLSIELDDSFKGLVDQYPEIDDTGQSVAESGGGCNTDNPEAIRVMKALTRKWDKLSPSERENLKSLSIDLLLR